MEFGDHLEPHDITGAALACIPVTRNLDSTFLTKDRIEYRLILQPGREYPSIQGRLPGMIGSDGAASLLCPVDDHVSVRRFWFPSACKPLAFCNLLGGHFPGDGLL